MKYTDKKAFLWALIKRELHQLLVVEPMRLLFLFGAALAYVVIFGILYSPNIVTRTPMVVYDEDYTAISRSLVNDFRSSDSYEIVAYVQSEEKMYQLLEEKKSYAALYIPKDFSESIRQGRQATALFMVNGSNLILTNATTTVAQTILGEFSDRIAVSQGALALGVQQDLLRKKMNPLSYEVRVLHNPIQGYVWFFIIGLAMVAFQQGIFFAVGGSIQYELDRLKMGTFGTEFEMPSTSIIPSLFVVKYILYWILSLLSFIVVALTAYLLWDIPVKGPWYELLILTGMFSFAFIGFSMLLSSLCSSEETFVRLSILYPMPGFLLSGYTWPQDSMPTLLQFISYLFPITWIANSMRQLFLIGHAGHFGLSLLVLGVMGSIFGAGAYYWIKNCIADKPV